MNPSSFSADLVILSPEEIITYIDENRSSIRALFLKEWSSKENIQSFELVLTTICTQGLSKDQFGSVQVQSLLVHLAYYFKWVNVPSYIDTCYSKIVNPYFRFRLNAWRKFTKYQNYAEHINQFESYLQLLTEAQTELDDSNNNELLQDLQEYLEYAKQNLSDDAWDELNSLAISEELGKKYALLNQFQEGQSSEIADLEIHPYDGEEYEPSDFALALFNEKFMDDIKEKSRPDFPEKLLGFRSIEILNDIIRKGQANFDEKYAALETSEIVNLYCYFNMRMHFYSSLSFYKRSEIYEQYYNTSGRIKFIDIGCGPATSGLAFLDYLYEKTGEMVVFDYYGIDTASSMVTKADEMLTNLAFEETSVRKYASKINDLPIEDFKNSTCIIINCCYVFASSTLEYKDIADYINRLSVAYPYIPKYLMYQNSPLEQLNQTYKKFKDLLNSHKIEISRKESIKYHNQQNPYYGAKTQNVYYELIQLS